MSSTAAISNPTPEDYIDKKKYYWLVSYLVPVIGFAGPMIYMATGAEMALWSVIIFVYLVIPFVDMALGEDQHNPPESAVPGLERTPYYFWIVVGHIPFLFALFAFCGWVISTSDLSWTGYLALSLTAGLVGGFALNLGHELGHKKNRLEQWLAKLVLAPAFYGHFFIEHNRGHHRHVATPEDPASSKMGENIYSFVLSELPGAIKRAYQIERARLIDAGKSPWSLENEFLHSVMMSMAFYLVMFLAFGSGVVPFLMIAAFFAMWQLTSANYIEHYGLLRQKKASGRYEAPQPHHSWNSNHIFSNLILFHLQRHSDHHANATRRYQSLRNFDNLPSLPNGYFGMYLLAYVPWLWFKVMDKRLIEATGGKVEHINFLPERKEELIRKYGLTHEQ